MRFRTVTMLFVFLAGSTILLAAGDSPKDPKQKSKDPKEEEVLTFTTADMERKYGKSAKPAPKPTGGPGAEADPLAQLQANQAAKREKVAQRAEGGARVRAAQEKVAALEKRIAGLRNPLLARSAPPEEDREAWDGADQAGRVQMTEKKLAAAREELAAARTALSKLG